ncbi:MAG TPA: glycosyltransferase family 2 protein [Caldilineaceae bacterium]|nr:glycosyltransferase family 2 protein [Caldilineaceae bacterium]
MLQTTADISVIICAYTENRWNDLVAAVASLKRQTVQPREIIVVIDENSSLLTRATVQFPDLTVIPNKEYRGLSGARNSGIAIAEGSILAFMDEDAFAEPEWIRHLNAAYTDAEILGVGGAIIPAWDNGQPAWFPNEFNWVVGCTYVGMPTTVAPVRNLIGCNMSFRREVFDQIGGFRQGMGRIGTKPLGCEETELCIRALQRWPSGVLLYQPLARVHHHVPQSRAQWDYFSARCYAEGLSKAQVAQLVGTGDGLSSEWDYTLHTLPKGALQGLTALFTRGDISGVGRAVAIVLGLAVTTVGYLRGRLAGRLSTQSTMRAAQPHFAVKELTQ